jgi:hypothetical protein
MAKLKTSFNMTSSTTSKSDPLSTYITAEVDVAAPLVQQGKLVTSASGDVIIDGTTAPYTTTDAYVYIRAAADNGTNIIKVSDDGGANKFAMLEADDWCFFPSKAGVGVKVAASAGTPTLEFAYFLRA